MDDAVRYARVDANRRRLNDISDNAEVNVMGKVTKSNKETKKKPGMTAKEKKAAKNAKKIASARPSGAA